MDQKIMLKQVLDFNKASFDNTFQSLMVVQGQTEKMLSTMLEQNAMMPEEAKKALQDWVESYKKGCEDYKKLVDDSFEKVLAIFDK